MELLSHRACAFCRSQKVRCIMEEENSEVCQRCVKAGRTCVFTPIQKRKQRKRTDTRVAELEREMLAMRSLLKEKQQAIKSGGPSRQRPAPSNAVRLSYEELSAVTPRHEAHHEQQTQAGNVHQPGQDVEQGRADPVLWSKRHNDRHFDKHGHGPKDVVDRGLISMATARQLFETYRNDLFPHYPMVHISQSVSADELRQTKPMLFLAVLAAAAGKQNPELSAMLDKEVLHAYARRSLVHSEKSLELVQALLLSSVWYHPPTKFGQLKYYEYIHMAATMALDIGIGARAGGQRNCFGKQQSRGRSAGTPSMHPLEDATNPDLSMTPRSRDSSPHTGSVESRRTFLACFIICALVSMSLRRPNMLRASSYIRECVDYIECCRDAVSSDRTVIAWVKLIIIQDEIGASFAYDDPGGIACITELRTQLMLKDFERKLTDWWRSTPEDDITGSLIITYYTTRLYLHEIALHVDHSPEDFKAPYQMGVIEPWQGDEIPSQILAGAIVECINCAHSLLDTFLSMSPESLRALPVFSFVRVSFAAFILAKLCLSATHPDSRIGRALDRRSLKAESFLERAIHHVREVVGSVRSRVPSIFLALLFKLRAWCLHPEMIEWSQQDRENSAFTAKNDGHRIFQNTPARKPELLRSAITGPRFTEQHNEGETSPAYHESDTLFGTMEDSAATGAASSLTPQSTSSDQHNTHVAAKGDTLFQPPDSRGLPDSTIGGDSAVPQTVASNNLSEQMELDAEFLQYFGDVNGLTEGGLTDLDDWSSLPTDIMGFDGSFGYSFSVQSRDGSTL